MRDLLAQDGIGGQPNGMEVAHIFKPFAYPGNYKGGVGAEEPHEIAPGIPGDHRVQNIVPAIGVVDVAVAQGAAFQHAELVEQEKRVVAAEVEMAVPGGPFLITMGQADGTVHVQHDVLQPVVIVEPVDPLAVQVGQSRPVPGQSQRIGLEEPPHLRCGGRPCIDGAPTHNLPHDRITGEPVRIVDILLACEPPMDRLPKQAVEPVDGVLAQTAIAQGTSPGIGQTERIIQRSRTTSRLPSWLNCVPWNSSRARRSKSTRSPRFAPAPSG